MKKIKNIGIISTRVEGTDGVSLEIEKWAYVLERNNYNCFYFAGSSDREKDKVFLVSEAHFNHTEIDRINKACIGTRKRSKEMSDHITKLKLFLKDKIYAFVRKFDIDLIIPENALAIPMNIPLGLAITEFIAETGFSTIAHHHDFYWERRRYLVTALKDYFDIAFPPNLKSIKHVVINSSANEQLAHRKGISSTIIHNVYDFAKSPLPSTCHCKKIREVCGLKEGDLLILQPTRIVPRKWVERALEIVSIMNLDNPTLVISHASGDEGDKYYKRVQEYAKKLNVRIAAIDDIIGSYREKISKNSNKRYTTDDIYECSDLVTYPSSYEGFGNAFLETIYHKKPIVVNRYSIYIADIAPKGFQVIDFDGFVTLKEIDEIYEILNNKESLQKMVETNFEKGKSFFSFEVLEHYLLQIIKNIEIE